MDKRLGWLVPGGGAGPWYQATPGRRAFLARLLLLLLEVQPAAVPSPIARLASFTIPTLSTVGGSGNV